jgi:IS4 transposase
VEVEGKERETEFLTNNPHWSVTSVAELYRCPWQIEVFFKQIEQTLQLCDFPGNSANAAGWQVSPNFSQHRRDTGSASIATIFAEG